MKFTSNFWVKVISPPNIFQCVQRFMGNDHWSWVISCCVTLQEVSKALHIHSFMESQKGSEQHGNFGKTIFRETQGKRWFTLRNLEPPQYWPRKRKRGRERETSEKDERINDIFPQFHNCHFNQANPPRRHFTYCRAGQDCDLCNATVPGSHTALTSHPSSFSQHARSVTTLH